jgi:hypothetical protein
MPLKHLRVCENCNTIRFGNCSITCHAPDPEDPKSWRENMQFGAGTMLRAAERQP